MLLSVRNIKVHYGSLEAVKGISLDVEEGESIALIGANGAGKSTVLRAISGINRPSSGEIWFQNRRIDSASPVQIVKWGISHVPEGKRLFGSMTVRENLLLGAYTRADQGEIRETAEEVYSLFPILKERGGQRASNLSGGEQQILAVGRALMSRPKLLLMDEPSLGLSPRLADEIADIIITLCKRGVSIVLVEQNVALALDIVTRSYVLQTGRVILEGESKELRSNEMVKKAYLGI